MEEDRWLLDKLFKLLLLIIVGYPSSSPSIYTLKKKIKNTFPSLLLADIDISSEAPKNLIWGWTSSIFTGKRVPKLDISEFPWAVAHPKGILLRSWLAGRSTVALSEAERSLPPIKALFCCFEELFHGGEIYSFCSWSPFIPRTQQLSKRRWAFLGGESWALGMLWVLMEGAWLCSPSPFPGEAAAAWLWLLTALR